MVAYWRQRPRDFDRKTSRLRGRRPMAGAGHMGEDQGGTPSDLPGRYASIEMPRPAGFAASRTKKKPLDRGASQELDIKPRSLLALRGRVLGRQSAKRDAR